MKDPDTSGKPEMHFMTVPVLSVNEEHERMVHELLNQRTSKITTPLRRKSRVSLGVFRARITANGTQEPYLFLMKHKKWGDFSLVGGHIEAGESPKEALVREVLEEVEIKGGTLHFNEEKTSDLEYCTKFVSLSKSDQKEVDYSVHWFEYNLSPLDLRDLDNFDDFIFVPERIVRMGDDQIASILDMIPWSRLTSSIPSWSVDHHPWLEHLLWGEDEEKEEVFSLEYELVDELISIFEFEHTSKNTLALIKSMGSTFLQEKVDSFLEIRSRKKYDLFLRAIKRLSKEELDAVLTATSIELANAIEYLQKR